MEQKKHSTGNRLRKARRRMGYSQLDVMRALGLKSTSRICRWESGKELPSVSNAIRLSRLYRTLINDLFPDIDAEAVQEIQAWMQEDMKRKNKPP